jgi:di/tricarboxylate transporter
MLPVATLSAFLNNTPVVAMFIPLVNDWCRKHGLAPGKLFIPLSYAAALGGACTLIGTSTNLVVQGLLIDSGFEPFSMFTLTPVGVSVAVVGIVFILATSRWLLPKRQGTEHLLADAREYTVEMIIEPGGPVDGVSIETAGLRQLPRCFLMEVVRGADFFPAPPPDYTLRGGDRLVFVGVVDSVVDLQRIRGLRPATDQVFRLEEPRKDRMLVEAVVSPTAPLVGHSIKEIGFRNLYRAVVLAVHRDGHRVAGKLGDIVLKAGDVLLLETHPRFLVTHRHSRYLFISSVPNSQPVRHERAFVALAAVLAVVVLSGFEGVFHVSLLTAGLMAAGLMLATGCCSLEQARRSIDLDLVLSIGAAILLGRGLDQSGAASFMGEGLLRVFRDLGPLGVLAGVYLATVICTELVTNNAAAVIVFPIAKAAAVGMGASFMPFAVTIAIAASAGFALPMGYQTHLMVYGPGGYRASDFLRVGLVLDAIAFVVTLTVAPRLFPF